MRHFGGVHFCSNSVHNLVVTRNETATAGEAEATASTTSSTITLVG